MECMIQCALVKGCKAVNVCPSADHPGQADCALLDEQNTGGCDQLQEGDNPSCLFVQRNCQNGGTPGGSKCLCQLQFAGPFCERRIRDCREAYNNGWTSSSVDGFYLIRPVTSRDPFQVLCKFSWLGSTVPLRRNGLKLTLNTWPAARNGQFRSPDCFFVGLENLHHLTNQAHYDALFIFVKDVVYGVKYVGFSVWSAAFRYELAFNYSYPHGGVNGSGNMFNGAPPTVFFTQDRDPNGCAGLHNAPGWYGSDCNGYSPFSDNVVLPVNGVDTPMENGNVVLIRTGSFDKL
ncbi:hypothetical protein V1264_024771 [Littorina saxatilis]|uniref:EGF-like domain-containing protein n=2 Tax=Littorina saxatilis TaxID=31220 RepID=A0AAN9ALM1_9CAEN